MKATYCDEEATYNGWTYNQAADRKNDLDDGYNHLTKALEALSATDYDTGVLLDELDKIYEQKSLMNFYMAKTKQKEDDANYRLSGDV